MFSLKGAIVLIFLAVVIYLLPMPNVHTIKLKTKLFVNKFKAMFASGYSRKGQQEHDEYALIDVNRKGKSGFSSASSSDDGDFEAKSPRSPKSPTY